MSKGTRKNRRDSNEPQIIDVFKDAGAYWQPCTRLQGHDGNLYYRGMCFAVEIKDGSKPISARRLTPLERQFKHSLELRGVRLWILLSVDDAIALINSDYAAIPERPEYETQPFDDVA